MTILTSVQRTAIVTDSTASISAATAERLGITIVPLQVVVGAYEHADGDDEVTPARIAEAMRSKVAVSTSRPAPASFAEVYERLADEGADEIVSIHISSDMSATYESALIASRGAPVPITAVDTRQVAMAVGYAAISAAELAQTGAGAAEVAALARTRADACTSFFYVDTLDHLRRGGRIGAAQALLGGALAVKPLLTITDGRVATADKIRTASRALARLQDLVVQAASEAQRPVEICVAHLDARDRAGDLLEALRERVGEAAPEALVGDIKCVELGAVLGAHVGPGMVAACVAPLP